MKYIEDIDFYNFLVKNYDLDKIIDNNFSEYNTLYLFSGIIRDYFINKNRLTKDKSLIIINLKDLDFVTFDKINEERLPFGYTKNHFNGYKFEDNGIKIDFWQSKNTWALKHYKKDVTIESLVQSPFFNFNSVLYDLKEKKFIYDDVFEKFIKDGVADIRVWNNPCKELQVYKIMECINEKNLRVTDRIISYLKNYTLYKNNETIYNDFIKDFEHPKEYSFISVLKLINKEANYLM